MSFGENLQYLRKQKEITQEQLAEKMGVSQSTIANKLRLLNLDEDVQNALLNEKISERHARALLSLAKDEQKKWLKVLPRQHAPNNKRSEVSSSQLPFLLSDKPQQSG